MKSGPQQCYPRPRLFVVKGLPFWSWLTTEDMSQPGHWESTQMSSRKLSESSAERM
jgi:hypothetical protein